MNSTNNTQKKSKSAILAAIGMIVMILLSLTQLVPRLRLAGIAVLVGVAFFFIVKAVAKTPRPQSGLCFKSFFFDLKKPGVLLWTLLPIVTGIVPIFIGDLIFDHAFSAHVLDRVDGMLSFENILLLLFQVLILAWGEEIAWRGFFLGNSMKKFPFWLCAVVSSVLFAMGHISDAGIWLLLYDLSFVFIDSMIFSIIFRKSGNCLVSTVSHILGNVAGLIVCFFLI